MSCPSCSGHVQFPAEGIGLTIDCPHCTQSFLLEDPQNIFAWMDKQKWPLDRAGVIKTSEAKLNDLRQVGIGFVSLLGSNGPDDCAACREIVGKKIGIESAPPLPLPGCDQKFCKCIYLAEK